MGSLPTSPCIFSNILQMMKDWGTVLPDSHDTLSIVTWHHDTLSIATWHHDTLYVTTWRHGNFLHSYRTSWLSLHNSFTRHHGTLFIATWRHGTLFLATWHHGTHFIATWHHDTLWMVTWYHDTTSIAIFLWNTPQLPDDIAFDHYWMSPIFIVMLCETWLRCWSSATHNYTGTHWVFSTSLLI